MHKNFKKQVFSSFDPHQVRSCNVCGKTLTLVRTMLDSIGGRSVSMFKCECGEQTWVEEKR